jgi:hypothetical protein
VEGLAEWFGSLPPAWPGLLLKLAMVGPFLLIFWALGWPFNPFGESRGITPQLRVHHEVEAEHAEEEARLRRALDAVDEAVARRNRVSSLPPRAGAGLSDDLG